MTILEPIATPDAVLRPVGDWHPTRYTPSLTGTEEFRTDGDRLLKFAGKHWSIAEAAVLTLDVWQSWLIRHVLERYPDDWPVEHLRGQLRFRQVVISIARQNGKSLIEALFAIYLLCMHVRGPRVIGVASIDRQAKIVYERVKYAIDNSAALTRELRTTNTRGIWRRDNSGVYMTLPAKEESAQGEPGTGVLADELHLMIAALWDAMIQAMKSKKNAIMIGITTAGDDSSELLIRLYREGENALAGKDERFGFFVWEADSDELTEAGVIAANPAVACGRIPLDQTMADAVKMWADTKRGKDGLTGRQRCIRYTLNRQIGGAADSWTNTAAWEGSQVDADELEHAGDLVFGLDVTEGWEWASITASSRNEDGTHATELVASLEAPTADTLFNVCQALARGRGRVAFAMDRRMLDDLGKRLQAHGRTVYRLTVSELDSSAQYVHRRIERGAIAHPPDPLVRLQSARARRTAVKDGGWRLSAVESLGDIDAIHALVMGTYVTTLHQDKNGLDQLG